MRLTLLSRFSLVPLSGGRRAPDRQVEPEDPPPPDRLSAPGKASHPFHGNGSRKATRARHRLGVAGQGGTGAHHGQLARLHRRGRSRPPQEPRPVPRQEARGPNEVWSWDISGIRFVTPSQRHSGKAIEICPHRARVYELARPRHPRR
jgi:hypothetical protein